MAIFGTNWNSDPDYLDWYCLDEDAVWDGSGLTYLSCTPNALNNQGEVVGTGTDSSHPNPEGIFLESGQYQNQQFLVDQLPLLLQGQVNSVTPSLISNQKAFSPLASTDASIQILSGAVDTGTNVMMLCKRDNSSNWTFAEMSLPEGDNIDGYATINSSGIIAALGKPNSVTTADHALLLVPVSLRLLNGQTQDFDGTAQTTVIPASENPNYKSDVRAAGTNALGALPMGEGRPSMGNNVYVATNMVAAKAPSISGIQYKWHRSVTAISWYIKKQTSIAGVVTWEVTQRDIDVTDDDTGASLYNNTTPSPDKNEFYIYDNSGIFYGGAWNDKGPDPRNGPTFMQVGDFIYMEKAFTYKVQTSTDGNTWTDAASIPMAQVITVRYSATGGTAATDWVGLGNIISQQAVTPSITEAKVRPIVGPVGKIEIVPVIQ